MNAFSGYIELTIEGEQIPFKFGSNAYGLFCEMHGLEFWEIGSSGVFGEVDDKGKIIKPPDMNKLRDLYFCAHQAAMRSKGQSEKLNAYQIGDLLDDNEDINLKLQETIIKSKIFGVTIDDLAKRASKEEPKKK
jgi:hypothetical protein